jgi:hypothetical protein
MNSEASLAAVIARSLGGRALCCVSPAPFGRSSLTSYKGFPTFVKQNSIVVNRVAIYHET